MSKKSSNTTPLMEQYLSIKSGYQDVILLYRMGDFYETFYEDAKNISKILGIALTKRAHGKSADVPLAGFPYHALDTYLPKLLNAGHRVAVCEQVEDPKLAKGVVKREVVEIASPGATMSDKLLDSKSNNFLVAVCPEGDRCGMALADVSTGAFMVTEFEYRQLLEQLMRYQPKEILVSEKHLDTVKNLTRNHLHSIFTRRDDWVFSRDYAYEVLVNHFNTHSLKGFGCEDYTVGVSAAGVVMHYLQENYKTRLDHFTSLQVVNLSRYMILDAGTRRNLELVESIAGTDTRNTLLDVLDFTRTPMGGRQFKQWLQHPLLDAEEIIRRHDIVTSFYDEEELREELTDVLKEVSDIERLLSRIVTGRANARDMLNLQHSLEVIEPVKNHIAGSGYEVLKAYFEKLDPLDQLIAKLAGAIAGNPPMTIQEGGIIRSGFNKELDELRRVSESGKDWLLAYQKEERERTGVSTLKVNYNKVFGYYIEITNVHKDKVPDTYIRKQTLVNAERFITPELKEWEDKILNAEEKINDLEYRIFQELRQEVAGYIRPIQENSRLIAQLDCFLSLAIAARKQGYIRPAIDTGEVLEIKNGRHPVVERNLPPTEDFIPNDTFLDNEKEQIWIITGPNMAGKSTFLRQVGLIVLMAQIGSYVPAAEARVGIVDRIFTRVGASDNLASGESTFLVEMNETANILNNATRKSLILLDEIGRGTSTFDGLSIAWAVSEYIHNHESIRSKTLFATHYHELTELSILYPRIRNYNVAVEEYNDQVVFLRKIIAGGTDNSYGIHVAEMAGLPPQLIERAREILLNLESNELSPNNGKPKIATRRRGRNVDNNQLSLFAAPKPSEVEKELSGVDTNNITPLQALQKLDELKRLVSKKKH